MDRYFSTRCYDDVDLCQFLDKCESNGIKVEHVVALKEDVYLVVYRWHEHVSRNGGVNL